MLRISKTDGTWEIGTDYWGATGPTFATAVAEAWRIWQYHRRVKWLLTRYNITCPNCCAKEGDPI